MRSSQGKRDGAVKSDSSQSDAENVALIGNPFEYESAVSMYELSKIVFFVVSLIAVIKAVLLVLVVGAAVVIGLVATIGIDRKQAYLKPYSKLRRAMLYPVGVCCRVFLFILGFHRIKVVGKPSPEAAFITPNHVSFIDALLMYWLTMPSAVAKAEIFNIPILGRLFIALQVIPVKRENPEARAETKKIMDRFAISRSDPDPGKRFPQVLIFPQGTTTKDTYVTMFQRGAFMSGLPVQPVAIKYPWKHFDPAWVVSREKDYWVRRVFTQFQMYVEVTFLPIHYPTPAEKADATLYANNVREDIARVLGAVTTDHYFEDAKLYKTALRKMEKKHVRQLFEKKSSGNTVPLNGLKVTEVKSIFGSHGSPVSEIERIFEMFKTYDKNGDGLIDYDEFCDALDYDPKAELTHVIWSFFDQDHSGTVDFRELVLGMAMTSPLATTEEKIKFAFDLFDENGDGLVSESELYKLMSLSRGGSFSRQNDAVQQIERLVASASDKGAPKDENDETLISWQLFKELVEKDPSIVDSAIRTVKPRTFSDSTWHDDNSKKKKDE